MFMLNCVRHFAKCIANKSREESPGFDWSTVNNTCLVLFTRQIRVYQHEKVGEKVGENSNACLQTVFVPFTHTNLSLPTRVCQLCERRISHEPNRMLMRENEGSFSFAFDSAHVKYGV